MMLTAYWQMERRSMTMVRHPILALLLTSIGCSQGPLCPELQSCGGNPLDKWAQMPQGQETPGTYCQEILHKPPEEAHLRGQLFPVARQPIPEKATADWCSELIVTGDLEEPVKRNNYWWEDLPYVSGYVEYKKDGSYTASLTRKAFVDRWLSQTCLRKYGFAGGCKDFEAALEKANQGAGEYNTFTCVENAARGGCNCNFEIFEVNALAGLYSISGSAITHFPSTPFAHYSQATMCVQGDTLRLSGMNNSFLFDKPGLRTIEMVRMNCNDGKPGPGELGIDCGLGCPNPCPTE
jgi:hypothetical protein